MSKYLFTMHRIVPQWKDLEVEAATMEEALDKAWPAVEEEREKGNELDWNSHDFIDSEIDLEFIDEG